MCFFGGEQTSLSYEVTHPPSYSGADQYTPTELVDTTVTLSSDGGDGGLRLGITPKSDSGSSLPATSSVIEIFPAYIYIKITSKAVRGWWPWVRIFGWPQQSGLIDPKLYTSVKYSDHGILQTVYMELPGRAKISIQIDEQWAGSPLCTVNMYEGMNWRGERTASVIMACPEDGK